MKCIHDALISTWLPSSSLRLQILTGLSVIDSLHTKWFCRSQIRPFWVCVCLGWGVVSGKTAFPVWKDLWASCPALSLLLPWGRWWPWRQKEHMYSTLFRVLSMEIIRPQTAQVPICSFNLGGIFVSQALPCGKKPVVVQWDRGAET